MDGDHHACALSGGAQARRRRPGRLRCGLLPELYPPLPPDLVAFAQGSVSLLVGTCSRDLVPDCVRGMGLRVWPDARHLTVLLPAATAATSIENLRGNPRLAVTASHIPSHRTFQVKGSVLAVRNGAEEDRVLATRYRKLLAEDLAFVGQPAANTLRLAIWPCHAVDIEIAVVYVQTPGPSAGNKLPLASGAP